jgi:hypothetical protein
MGGQEQLLAVTGRKSDAPGQAVLAGEFLLALLKKGPRPTVDIWPVAHRHGFSRTTLRRARKNVGVRILRTWTGNRLLTYWHLPGQTIPEAIKSQEVPGIQTILQPMIDKYPTTPLDD